MQEEIAGSQSGVQLLQCITDFKGVVSSQEDGQEPAGLALVPEWRQFWSCRIFARHAAYGNRVTEGQADPRLTGKTHVFNSTYNDDQKSSHTDYTDSLQCNLQ